MSYAYTPINSRTTRSHFGADGEILKDDVEKQGNGMHDTLTHVARDVSFIALIRCFLTFFLLEPMAEAHSTRAFESDVLHSNGDWIAAVGNMIIPIVVSSFGVVAGLLHYTSIAERNQKAVSVANSTTCRSVQRIVRELSASGLIFCLGMLAFACWPYNYEMHMRLVYAKILLVFSSTDFTLMVLACFRTPKTVPVDREPPCYVKRCPLKKFIVGFSFLEVSVFVILAETGVFDSSPMDIILGTAWCVITFGIHAYIFKDACKINHLSSLEKWALCAYVGGQYIPYIMYYLYEII
jgi:hypothetical protein